MAAIEPPPSEDTVWLGEYLAVLRRRKWSIIVITLLALLAGVIFAKQQTNIYESTAKVLATVPVPAATGGSQSPNMTTEESVVTSNDVTKCASLLIKDPTFRANPTGADVNLDTLCSTDALNAAVLERFLDQNVVVTVVSGANVMTIAYNSAATKAAEGGAQAFALAYIHQKITEANATLTKLRQPFLDTETKLNADIAKWNAQIASTINKINKASAAGNQPNQADQENLQNLENLRNSANQQLNETRQQLQNLDPSKINPPELLLPAQLPQKPISPNLLLDALFGLLAGLAVGVALAFLRERLDDGLRGRTDLEQNLGVPVLAVIPKVPGWRNKHDARLVAREQPKSAVAEAYRTLRTSVSFLSVQRGLKCIMVVSAAAGEGKTTTAANLAVVLADAGKRVVLLSGDLRKPRVARFFDLPNDVGLSTVLAGESEPWEAILDPGVENLRVLLSGPVPSRPAEMLQSEQMGEVMAGLREVADFVIVDTAPVLLVTDALALAPLVDGVLFVADAERTSRSAVSHAREQLEQVGATVIGSILNNFDPSKARGYRYHGYFVPYRYRYGYGSYATYGAPYEENGGRRGQPAAELPPQDRRNP